LTGIDSIGSHARTPAGAGGGGGTIYIHTYIINEQRHATSTYQRGGGEGIPADYTTNTYSQHIHRDVGGEIRQAAVAPGGKETATAAIVDEVSHTATSGNKGEGTDTMGETIDEV
jgi:hypothetical protein